MPGMEGRCQCGLITFTAPLDEPSKIYVCHCLECRWQAASSYGLSAMFPAFDFPTEVKEHIGVWSRKTFEGRTKNCYFCRNCGTRLYHHKPGQRDYTVKAGCLVDLNKEMMDRAVHIWTKRAIVDIPPEAEQYDEEPPEEVDDGGPFIEPGHGDDGGAPLDQGLDDIDTHLQPEDDDDYPMDEPPHTKPLIHPYTTVEDDENLPIVGEVDDAVLDVTSDSARQRQQGNSPYHQ